MVVRILDFFFCFVTPQSFNVNPLIESVNRYKRHRWSMFNDKPTFGCRIHRTEAADGVGNCGRDVARLDYIRGLITAVLDSVSAYPMFDVDA